MMSEPCRDMRGALGAAALGNLEPAEEVALRAHLDGCAACRAELRALTSVARALPLADPKRVDAGSTQAPRELGDLVLGRIALASHGASAADAPASNDRRCRRDRSRGGGRRLRGRRPSSPTTARPASRSPRPAVPRPGRRCTPARPGPRCRCTSPGCTTATTTGSGSPATTATGSAPGRSRARPGRRTSR